ncbi:MAG: hypothetical protein ABG776_03445 [Cyanobacteria bacterium J06555_13]
MTTSRYPQNWKQRSLECRDSANWTCQHCHKHCRRPQESLEAFIVRTGYPSAQVKAHPRRWSAQAAHINHDRENPDAELIALCLPCHRRYDNPQMAKIKRLERERDGQLSLENLPPEKLSGYQLPLDNSLSEPYGLANVPQTGKPASVVAVKGWIETRLALLPSHEARLRFLRQFNRDSSPEYRARMMALRQSLPLACPDAAIETACMMAYQELCNRENLRKTPKPRRRYRSKGQASGYIEQREGNKKRRAPTISYYYRWDSELGRLSEYIPATKLYAIQRLIDKGTPAIQILQFLSRSKKKMTPLAQQLIAPDTAQTSLNLTDRS